MAYGEKVAFEPLREIAFGAIGASYVAFGTPTVDQGRLLSISNGMDADIYISFDGVNDHIRVSANGFDKSDLTINGVDGQPIFLAKNTQIYIKQVTAPTAGTAWISLMYAAGGK